MLFIRFIACTPAPHASKPLILPGICRTIWPPAAMALVSPRAAMPQLSRCTIAWTSRFSAVARAVASPSRRSQGSPSQWLHWQNPIFKFHFRCTHFLCANLYIALFPVQYGGTV